MGDYFDSQQFTDHPLFQQDKNALQINLFYDDLEVCNPLGSKAKIHKLGKSHITHVCIRGVPIHRIGKFHVKFLCHTVTTIIYIEL